MRIHTLESTEETPVSHNPELKKKVLVPEGVGCVRHISHIILREGDTAALHSHENGAEVFYCVSGEITFSVNGGPVRLIAGSCLVVEPDEEHAIVAVGQTSEMLYMMVAR